MFLRYSKNKYKHKVNKGLPAICFLAILLLLFSCNENRPERNIERSFYFWKTVFRLDRSEETLLNQLNVKTIYVKFFDVDWDETGHKPLPLAILQNRDYHLPAGIQIIPVVFITNECIQQIDSSQINLLAQNLTGLIRSIGNSQHFPGPVPEIQVDCDWTASTKDNYFTLLKTIKQLNNTLIAATIRLHQIKFIEKTGVPPVDKGLLMCYNMGNSKNPATKNSILETEELKKYTGNLSTYPLPLDVALPLFDWKVLFRQNQYKGLIQNLPDTVFTVSFSIKKDNRFEILKDTSLMGYDFIKGDIIRKEESNYSQIMSTIEEISKHLKNTHPRVALYHLDSLLLRKYTPHEFENIFNGLR